MEKQLFFMANVQLKASEILKVEVLESVTCGVLSILPRVVINQQYVFEGTHGIEAIKQLCISGFYTDEQRDIVSKCYCELLEPINNVLSVIKHKG